MATQQSNKILRMSGILKKLTQNINDSYLVKGDGAIQYNWVKKTTQLY